MNEPEANLQSTPISIDLLEENENLRRQVNLLFGALVVLSFTLTIFLGLQARRASIDYSVTKPQADAALKAFQQDEVSLQAGLEKLREFGRTHPDFQKQVLAKSKLYAIAPAEPKK